MSNAVDSSAVRTGLYCSGMQESVVDSSGTDTVHSSSGYVYQVQVYHTWYARTS